MHLRPPAKAAIAALLVLLLGGCERTLFQAPPSDSRRCDRALIGEWASEEENGANAGELVVRVGKDCSIQLTRYGRDGIVQSPPGELRSDKVAGTRYLWLDVDWAHDGLDVASSGLEQAGDVYVFAYATQGRERLVLYSVRHRALAHRILDKDIDGEIVARPDALTVRVGGDTAAVAALLRKYRLFDLQDGGVRFRRRGAEMTR